MQFEGAKIREQGVIFGIVVVRAHVLTNRQEEFAARALGTKAFGLIPIVLMTQDGRGIPTYQGRPDIVKFLSHVDIRRIQWQKYTSAA